MTKIAYGLLQLAGLALIAVGVSMWSIPAAFVVVGVLLLLVGEVRG